MASEMSKGLKQGIGFAIGGCGCLMLCIVGCLVMVGTGVEGVKQKMEQSQTQTKAAFDSIQMGMTYEEVVGLVGEPTETSSDSEIADIRTTMYTWQVKDSLGANFNVMIQNGQVVNKAQFGLK